MKGVKKKIMIKGIGIDIVQIGRVKRMIEEYGDRFLNRTFTQKEIAYCQGKSRPSQHYAGRFAAKEALMKAAGQALVFTEIEIEAPGGKPPAIRTSGKAKETIAKLGIKKIFLSISHDHEYAVAQVVASN